jgi:hypothetical protein
MKNLKNNIWLESFDSEESIYSFISDWNGVDGEDVPNFLNEETIIYKGKSLDLDWSLLGTLFEGEDFEDKYSALYNKDFCLIFKIEYYE